MEESVYARLRGSLDRARAAQRSNNGRSDMRTPVFDSCRSESRSGNEFQ
jgi:hypothetical protein